MIKSVTVTNAKDEELVLELRHPEKSGLIVKRIDGLGPPKASLNTTELSILDGTYFNSVRAGMRNIVLSLQMMHSPTIEEARRKTYQFFPIKGNVKIRIETDQLTAEASGWVESNEPDIFSMEESCQISVLCPDPYFYDAKQEEVVFGGIQPLFEFPFSNESVTEPLLEFSRITVDTRTNLRYKGDVDTGILITLHAQDVVENPTLYNVMTRERMAIRTDYLYDFVNDGFRAGDDIIISTHEGKKSVQLLRNGHYMNVISVLPRDSDWFKLTPGDNIFNFVAEKGQTDLVVTFTYRNAYGGM